MLTRRGLLKSLLGAAVAAAVTRMFPKAKEVQDGGDREVHDPGLLECHIQIDAALLALCPDRNAYIEDEVRLYVSACDLTYGRQPDRIVVSIVGYEGVDDDDFIMWKTIGDPIVVVR